MKRIRKMLEGRSLLLLAAAAIVALGMFVASVPSAKAVVIAGPHVCSYYSNANYSKVVGARGTGCCGEPISWGITTKYVRCEQLYCTDNLCPN
jgi:hypothetical protein